MPSNDAKKEIWSDRYQRIASDRLNHLQRELSFLQATSAEGAFLQLMVASGEIDLLATSEFHSKWDETELQLRVNRLLYSVANYFRTNGADPMEEIAAYYMSPAQSPALMLADAVKEAHAA